MSKTFVMGDMHGAYRALRQCLERSEFDLQQDHLICLGDVCDGWPDTKACTDELLRLKNLTLILGNHDYWALEWMTSGYADDVWQGQGGLATMQSYAGGVPESHIRLFKKALPYSLRNDKLFVHAGIDPTRPLRRQGIDIFLWDRTLATMALERFTNKTPGKLTSFDEVYIGHTVIHEPQPVQGGEVWLMDTGAGWSGVLSMMNIETREVFTSDLVPGLYQGVQGRVKRI